MTRGPRRGTVPGAAVLSAASLVAVGLGGMLLTGTGGVRIAASARAPAQVPGPRPVGTLNELMVSFIYPASDALFYIESRTPETEEGWLELEGKVLMLAESANLLMSPERAWDADQWMRDAELLRDAGARAFEAVKRRDVEALVELNDALYESCTTCHQNFRPNFRRGP